MRIPAAEGCIGSRLLEKARKIPGKAGEIRSTKSEILNKFKLPKFEFLFIEWLAHGPVPWASFMPCPQVAGLIDSITVANKDYSPIIWQMMVLVLGLVSKSTKIICCQVPSVSCLSTIGMANEGPKTEART
jgi:hypothetical protein